MNKYSSSYYFNIGTYIQYDCYGEGARTLICFHGFGQQADLFLPLANELNNYRVLSINLFFHGESQRSTGTKYLKHPEWQAIFTGLLKRESVTRFSILGFSMGGRYVISSLLSFQNQIDRVILIAPDGIVQRFWFEFATMPLGPAQLFSQFMHHPTPFFRFLDFLERTKIMNPTTIKFSRSQLKNEAQRIQVLNCWIMLRHLEIPQKKLSRLLETTPQKSILLFGSKDRVIDHQEHLKFFKTLRRTQVETIAARHHEILDRSIHLLTSALHSME